MTSIPTLQPDALRLADAIEKMPGYDWNKTYCEAAFQLRHQHDEITRLKAESDALLVAYQRDLHAAICRSAAMEREACAELMEQQHIWITSVAASTLIRARDN